MNISFETSWVNLNISFETSTWTFFLINTSICILFNLTTNFAELHTWSKFSFISFNNILRKLLSLSVTCKNLLGINKRCTHFTGSFVVCCYFHFILLLNHECLLSFKIVALSNTCILKTIVL